MLNANIPGQGPISQSHLKAKMSLKMLFGNRALICCMVYEQNDQNTNNLLVVTQLYWTYHDLFFFFAPCSCFSGTDNIKHQNTVELFGEIDPKVRLSPVGTVHSSTMSLIPSNLLTKVSLFHPGIQTQTHRQVCVVLFTKSRGWEIMAKTYQRQDKGDFHSLKNLSVHGH